MTDFGRFFGKTAKVTQNSRFWPILAQKAKSAFFAKFQLEISQQVFAAQKRSRHEKSSKIDQVPENVAKKGFLHPQRTQNQK